MPRQRRILVVEDSPTQAERLRLLLEEDGYQVELAGSGREGLGKVGSVQPDLIISDIIMPEMDGYSFCQAIKSRESTRRIPFIFFTERQAPMDIIEGLLRGADNFIPKSSADDYLLERVRRILKQLEHRGEGGLTVEIIVRVGDRDIPISADRQQIFELLISTLEETSRVNDQLREAQRLLEEHARRLEDKVQERTRELRESQEQFRLLLDSAAEAIYGIDLDGTCTFANPASARLLAYGDAGELVGRSMHGLIHYRRPDGTPCPEGECRMDHAFRGGEPAHADDEVFWRADGTCFPVEYWSYPLRRGERLEGAVVTFLDITERRRTETYRATQFAVTRVLSEAGGFAEAAARLLRVLCENLGWQVGALWMADPGSKVLRCAEVWRQPSARVDEFVQVTRRLTFTPGFGLPGGVWSSGEPLWIRDVSLELGLERAPVAARDGLHAACVFPIPSDGEVIGVVELFSRDVREADPDLLKAMSDVGVQIGQFRQRKWAEEELRATQERLRHLVSSSPAILYSLKVEGQRLPARWLSGNIEPLLGYTEEESLAPSWWIERVHPEDREWVMGQIPDLLAEGHLAREYRFLHKDGRYRWIRDEQRLLRDAGGNPVEVVGSWSEVTERKALEAQLLQSQKMEAVGRLAGGVAHDFNNLLGVITGYGDLLLRDIGPDHPGAKRVEEIRKAAERAAALTRQLLAFSRKQVLQPRLLDLNTVLADIEKMLRRLIGEDVQLVTVFTEGLGRVKADPGQMEQVIVNLAVNARDAMPQGGRLILETANVELDNAYIRMHAEARPGPHVMLAVSDTGHGMSPETLSHMFEPFFTTKEEGKGTGLGLATVYGIVKQSGGHINVYSEVGRGSTFKVYLPRVLEEEKAEAARAAAGAPAPSGSETILLVEDEESLRTMIGEILEGSGYTVLQARAPEEAISLVRSHEGPVHLILTDVVLPRMSGREVAAQVVALRPGVRVLYMSGYTDEAVVHHGVLDPEMQFIQKPFTADALLRKLREALDASAGPRA